MEVGASCHDGIQLWPLPRWGCCLLGGISKKLLRGTAVGVWDKWRLLLLLLLLLLLGSPRTTNAGLLSCCNWCSGYCTWGGVGTGRNQTKLHVEILEWGKMKQLSYSFISICSWLLHLHKLSTSVFSLGRCYSSCVLQNPGVLITILRSFASSLCFQ